MSDTIIFDQDGESKADVLLVCRCSNTLGALAAILNKAGSAVLTAQTPVDAWKIVRRGAVGCVVLDITLLSHDALQLFRACRTSRNTFGIPFLFLTTIDCLTPKFEDVWPETARDAWISLPCPSPQFLTAVRNLLAANVRMAMPPIETSAPADHMDGSVTPPVGLSPVLKNASGTNRAPPTQSGRLAVNAANLENAIFSGKLGTLQFSQILGLIEPLRLTGTLKIFDGVRTGDVYFVDGKVHHAELNEIVGSEALFLLFHLNKGSFQFEMGPPTTFRTVEGNTMSLLLEGMRQMDEVKASISAFKERQNTGAYAPILVGRSK